MYQGWLRSIFDCAVPCVDMAGMYLNYVTVMVHVRVCDVLAIMSVISILLVRSDCDVCVCGEEVCHSHVYAHYVKYHVCSCLYVICYGK